MAAGEQLNPDSETRKWFVIAMVCSFLFVGVVFTFVLRGNDEAVQAQQEEGRRDEQPN